MPRANSKKVSAVTTAPKPYDKASRAKGGVLKNAVNGRNQVRAPVSGPYDLQAGDLVRVRVKKNIRKVWRNGVIGKFLGPVPIGAAYKDMNGNREVVGLYPVRFRLHVDKKGRPRGPEVLMRFSPNDIVLVERKTDENTEPR